MNKTRTLYLVIILHFLARLAFAQAFNITGVVRDSITGNPLDRAMVRLLNCGLADTTDATGTFILVRPPAAITSPGLNPVLPAPALFTASGKIRLRLAAESQVAIKAYTVTGRLVNSLEKVLGAGEHVVAPALTGSGVYLYRVVIGGRSYTLKQVCVKGGVGVSPRGEVGQAKSAADAAALFPDTIIVTKTGYNEKRVVVTDSVVSGLELRCAQKECAAPVFVTGDPNGGWSTAGYYVHNNMWNSASYPCAETLYACSHGNWYVVANMNNNTGDGAVKTYPNVHKDYNNSPLISSFTAITSTFAAQSPHVGIYNVAYDIWTNGVATPGCTEFMIWTENFNQVPAGTRAAVVTLGGRAYDVWKTANNGYIAFIPDAVFTSGTVDLLGILNWTISQGWLPANSTLGQICFGVEIVSTDGIDATFTFTDFSITAQ